MNMGLPVCLPHRFEVPPDESADRVDGLAAPVGHVGRPQGRTARPSHAQQGEHPDGVLLLLTLSP